MLQKKVKLVYFFTRKKGKFQLTAGVALVGAVVAVGPAVAELALLDALLGGVGAARAGELVVGAGDGGAVLLVGAVGAVLVAVAAPPGGDAEVVLAPELPRVAGGKVWNGKRVREILHDLFQML